MTGFWILRFCNIAQKAFSTTFRKTFFVSFTLYHLNESMTIPHFYYVYFECKKGICICGRCKVKTENYRANKELHVNQNTVDYPTNHLFNIHFISFYVNIPCSCVSHLPIHVLKFKDSASVRDVQYAVQKERLYE